MKTRSLLHRVVVLTAIGILCACSDSKDQDASTDRDSSPSTAKTEAPESSNGTISSSLDNLGFALETAMGSEMDGYTVKGSTLRIRMKGASGPLSTACSTIQMVAGSISLPTDAVVEVEHDDGVEDCKI